jgi:hypothetical protein
VSAWKEAQTLESTHPLRLALACNYSTFKHEVKEDFSGAIDIATSAFDESLKLFKS